MIAMHLYQGVMKIIPIDPDGALREAFNIRLEEPKALYLLHEDIHAALTCQALGPQYVVPACHSAANSCARVRGTLPVACPSLTAHN